MESAVIVGGALQAALIQIEASSLVRSAATKAGVTMAATAKLSRKFRISIPKAVRDAQNWQAGQELVFIPKGHGVLVLPAPGLEQLAGIAMGARSEGHRDRS